MCLSIKVERPECLLSEGEHAGFKFATTHNTMGYRCGYVRVPNGHPWHGKDYDEINADVHCGLTFGEPDKPCNEPGADDAYWFGFDCAHAGVDARDPLLPMRYILPDFPGGTVRSQKYVEAQCRRLCKQAALASKTGA